MTCRKQIGWSREELFDEDGNPRERTDGAKVPKRRKDANGQEIITDARYEFVFMATSLECGSFTMGVTAQLWLLPCSRVEGDSMICVLMYQLRFSSLVHVTACVGQYGLCGNNLHCIVQCFVRLGYPVVYPACGMRSCICYWCDQWQSTSCHLFAPASLFFSALHDAVNRKLHGFPYSLCPNHLCDCIGNTTVIPHDFSSSLFPSSRYLAMGNYKEGAVAGYYECEQYSALAIQIGVFVLLPHPLVQGTWTPLATTRNAMVECHSMGTRLFWRDSKSRCVFACCLATAYPLFKGLSCGILDWNAVGHLFAVLVKK